MNAHTPPPPAETDAAAPAPGRLAAVLVGGAVFLLAGAGLLLWASQGAAVFNDVVLAALAWCF
ncbi:hypothetical protein [Salinarimonas sp.]|uniref:hypothetical protein n=1 Tax=Salinarimonas sp. TaxID=2766526 RepID=UPI0032D8E6EE